MGQGTQEYRLAVLGSVRLLRALGRPYVPTLGHLRNRVWRKAIEHCVPDYLLRDRKGGAASAPLVFGDRVKVGRLQAHLDTVTLLLTGRDGRPIVVPLTLSH